MDYINDSETLFYNRRDAGRQLAEVLTQYKEEKPLLLSLPKGGDLVGHEIATILKTDFDIVTVLPLIAPGYKELSIGAISETGVRVVDHYLLQWLGISEQELGNITKTTLLKLEETIKTYRANSMPQQIEGRTVILIDDSLTTDLNARAAIQSIKNANPKKIILAVPVSSPESALALRPEVDEFICLSQPIEYAGKILWYKNLQKISDEQVADLLKGNTNLSTDEEIPSVKETTLTVPSGTQGLAAALSIPEVANKLVVFIHDIGSNRLSLRNRYIGQALRNEDIATLHVDLCTHEELSDNKSKTDALLKQRLADTVTWLRQNPYTSSMEIAFFAGNESASSAIHVALELNDINEVIIRSGEQTNIPQINTLSVSKDKKTQILLISPGQNQEIVTRDTQFASQNPEIIRHVILPNATTEFTEIGVLDIMSTEILEFLQPGY